MRISRGVFCSTLGLLLCLTISLAQLPKANAAAEEGKKLPIIMYHSVLRDPKRAGEYIVSPQTVENDFIYLKQHGYTAITAFELAEKVLRGGGAARKACYDNL